MSLEAMPLCMDGGEKGVASKSLLNSYNKNINQ